MNCEAIQFLYYRNQIYHYNGLGLIEMEPYVYIQ